MTQYATFLLGDRMFGLDIRAIREINRILDITPVPHAEPHIRGLINLRGQIVTIVDLGVRLGLPRGEITAGSHNIILKTGAERQAGSHQGASARDLMGLLVDAIGDVVEADQDRLEPLSANVGDQEGRFLEGVVKADWGLFTVLDLAEVLAQDTA